MAKISPEAIDRTTLTFSFSNSKEKPNLSKSTSSNQLDVLKITYGDLASLVPQQLSFGLLQSEFSFFLLFFRKSFCLVLNLLSPENVSVNQVSSVRTMIKPFPSIICLIYKILVVGVNE